MVVIFVVLGIVLVVLHRDVAPQACRVAGISLVALLAVHLMAPAFEWFAYSVFGSQRQGGLFVSAMLRVFGWVVAVVQAASIGGLAVSVLLDRGLVFDRQSPFGRKRVL